MSTSGLTLSPSRFSFCITATRGSILLCERALVPLNNHGFRGKAKILFRMERAYWTGSRSGYGFRKAQKIMSAMGASFGDMADDATAVFPRMNIKDPYKRLGISQEASEEEIQAARNFLVNKYAGHKPSVDAIESAHDKIIMQKFYERKNPKINVKKKVRDVTQSRVVQAVTSRFVTPSTTFMIKTVVAYAVLGALTVLFPTEDGPTVQVAISLLAAIYFIYERLKSTLRAFLYGIGTFFGSWLVGTLLMVSVIPPLFRGPRSLEVSTSLITYVFLWISSTYLK